MYTVSETFKEYIKKNTVTFAWHGEVVDKNGNSYELKPINIAQNTGKITKRCSTDKLSIGTTCAAELQTSLYLNVSRYLLYGGVITLYFTLDEGEDTEDVEMGSYNISECTQSNGQLHVLAYDNMTKFDAVKFSPALHTVVQSPYMWLVEACTACGVTLGMTKADVASLPNGSRNTGFADVVPNITSWRDVIGYLATYLGSFAYIGRDGKLYLATYTGTPVDTVTTSLRYSSDLSDFRTTYDGLYAIHKDGGMQEYVANSNTDGLVLDVGVNPFLQFRYEANRLSALREIIKSWDGVYYVPFKSNIPIMPHYDLGDVLLFTGNQASTHDYGALTEIVYSIGGRMSIACAGENPLLADAQDRFSKSVEGLSSEYSNGQEIGGKNFWLLHTPHISESLTVSTRTQVAEIEFEQTTDVQKIGFNFTCDGDLSDTALIKVEITVDDESEYTFEVTNKYLLGTRHIPVTWGYTILGKGTHVAKVYMTVTNSPLTWGELA